MATQRWAHVKQRAMLERTMCEKKSSEDCQHPKFVSQFRSIQDAPRHFLQRVSNDSHLGAERVPLWEVVRKSRSQTMQEIR